MSTSHSCRDSGEAEALASVAPRTFGSYATGISWPEKAACEVKLHGCFLPGQSKNNSKTRNVRQVCWGDSPFSQQLACFFGRYPEPVLVKALKTRKTHICQNITEVWKQMIHWGCLGGEFATWLFWLVVSTHLKKYYSQNGFIFPKFRGENQKNTWNYHPESFMKVIMYSTPQKTVRFTATHILNELWGELGQHAGGRGHDVTHTSGDGGL